MASFILQERLSIPLGLSSLDEFRAWSRSDEFPETGRIDYIGGDIEVDMSPEDVFTHGTLKAEIAGVLLARVKQLELGYLLIDRSRFSHGAANLSVEPDILLITHDAIESKRVTFVPKAGEEADRFIEIEGSPDLVVEIISDSSVRKDRQRLHAAYHAAGVAEYWLADARGPQVTFQIHRWTPAAYVPATADADGFQHSTVMSARYRLLRSRGKHGFWQYALEVIDS